MNSLNALRGWLREKPDKALTLLDALTKELRSVLDWRDSKEVPLKEEIELCRPHLVVMGLRHDRHYELVIQGIQKNEIVPPLIFHTMVENVFTHNDPLKISGLVLQKEQAFGSVRYRFRVD